MTSLEKINPNSPSRLQLYDKMNVNILKYTCWGNCKNMKHILSTFSIPSIHYWLFVGVLFLYTGLYALYSFRKNSNSLILNQSILQKFTFNLDSINRFFKLSLILFVLMLAWDIIANFNNFNAVFIIVFIVIIIISLLLGFIVQLFKTKWTLIGTTNNWLIVWCVSVCINIIILFLFKP